MSLELTLTPVPRDIFTPNLLAKLLDDSLSFVSTIPSSSPPSTPPQPTDSQHPNPTWTATKRDPEITIWRTSFNNEPWIARVTRVRSSYAAARTALIDDRAAAEKVWLDGPRDTMEEVGRVVVEGGIRVLDFRRFLHIQAFAGREFLQSVVSRDVCGGDGDGVRAFVVVSLPIEGEVVSTLDVRGRYVSVDYVREVGDGMVEVYMALCSDAGGSIPRWVQNMALPGQIYSDGRKFLEYLRERQGEGEVETEVEDEKV